MEHPSQRAVGATPRLGVKAKNSNIDLLPYVASSPAASNNKSKSALIGHYSFGSHLMIGLTMAGVASALLQTMFSLFHVDVFLRAYQLPLASYSFGSFVFPIVNTINNLLGAWLVDSIATRMPRTDLIGITGCVFSVCFLGPFFRG